MTQAARLVGVHKAYLRARERVPALRGIDLTVDRGEVVALMGPSGSGKSTVLMILAGWETPDAGEVVLFGDEGQARTLSWSDVGVVPQGLGLLDDLSVRDNVTLSIRLAAGRADAPRVDDLMVGLDLEEFADRRPSEISLGQQQRIAVARALGLRPRIVLADEPTTHQDAGHADLVFAVLRAAADAGAAVVVATHDPAGTRRADRVLPMADGQILVG